MEDKYKYCGEKKRYVETDDLFIKFHLVAEEFLREINGYQMFEKINLPTTKIKTIDHLNKSIGFEKIGLKRIDQYLREPEFKDVFCLKMIGDCADLIAKLHRSYEIPSAPNYDLQTERFVRLQNDLRNFGNIPSKTAERAKNQILQKFSCFSANLPLSSFIHGDFIPQNFFYGKQGEIIIFDLENSCFSDPMYDLSCFVSFFFIIAVKSDFYNMQDVISVEERLLGAYSRQRQISEFDYQRFLFFKFFGHHCMYWYYLLLLGQLADKTKNEKIDDYLNGTLPDNVVKLLIEELRKEQFSFKISSFENIAKFLKRSDKGAVRMLRVPNISIIE